MRQISYLTWSYERPRRVDLLTLIPVQTKRHKEREGWVRWDRERQKVWVGIGFFGNICHYFSWIFYIGINVTGISEINLTLCITFLKWSFKWSFDLREANILPDLKLRKTASSRSTDIVPTRDIKNFSSQNNEAQMQISLSHQTKKQYFDNTFGRKSRA